MTTEKDNRLAEMRAQWTLWSALTDTSAWESTLFFEVLDEKNREIEALRSLIQQKSA